MKNIILLSPGPFLKRDYDRFGIEFLKKNFSVKILDFTKWIYPDFWKIYSKNVYKCKEYIIISCKNDFLAFNLEADPIIILDCLVKNRKTNWARKQLKKRHSVFVKLDVNQIPYKRKNIIESFCFGLIRF